MDPIITEWSGCYPSNWKGMIVEDAYAHPAKFSNKLIRRIYEHILKEGWVTPGDVVVDPFGGVGLGAIFAMQSGLSWRGCELETRFVEWGNKNIAFWNSKFSAMPKWSGDAVLLHGDSRNLVRVLRESVAACVSSSPYAASINSDNGIDLTKIRGKDKHVGKNSQANQETNYGVQGAQLGAMKATEKGFQAAVSSPPFLQTSGGVNVTSLSGPLADPAVLARHAAGNSNVGYGDTDGNMGSTTPDDFWSSAKIILEQVYELLEPGGRACWVVKNYVKGGKEVPFCAQWRALCESVGFATIHEHHAMLVRNVGLKTTTLEGETINKEVSSKSFFRRIAEKKGAPPIDFEVVYCMVKPI